MSTEPLVVPSPSIEQRRPRLGGGLMRAGFIAFVGFPGLILMFMSIVGPDRVDASPVLSALLFLAAFLGLLVAPCMVIIGAVLTSVSFPRPSSGFLRAEDGGLVIVRGGRERRLARADIEGGLVLPGALLDAERPRVAFHLRRGGVLTAEVPDGMTSHRLLDRLGIDAARRRVAVSIGSPYRPLATGCVTLPIVCILFLIPVGYWVTEDPSADWPIGLFAWAVVLTMFVLVQLTRPREVIVGSDGLRIRGGFEDRWIRYAHVRSVDTKPRVLSLEMAEEGERARRIEVATGEPSVIQALAGRIRIAIALGSNGAEGPPVGAELDPAGKSFTEWKDKLQSLLLRPEYRKTAVTPEALLSVVDDPDLPPGQRLGAAVALRSAQHPEAPARIRVAAEACADEAMQQALEEAAAGELGERAFRRVLDGTVS
ncbi:hypothetical protein [Polyangium spumosum]|uniref:PH domain-containing protein n=1 Tax=Polyangium spumosum TaxID=889282 RepID=A0A6N7PVU2_9BACT|nr:hypothetical protein [Polyangium spumosum]MRG94194.1 hypothetical protein [Polyangium spumosum]